MAGQLIPPPELDPPMNRHLSVRDRILVYLDLIDSTHQFLLAGLRERVGPGGDLDAAYRSWYENTWGPEHDEAIINMARRIGRYGGRGNGAE